MIMEPYMIIILIISLAISGWAFNSLAEDYIKEIKRH